MAKLRARDLANLRTAAAAVDTEVATMYGKVDTEVAAILEDSGTTIPGTITTMQGNVTDILTDTGTTIPGTITALQADVDAMERCVEKSDGAVLSGADNLFTIAGGPIIAKIVGIVTTEIGGAANGSLQITTTAPAATAELNAAPVAIDADAVGTSYRNVGATSVFTPVTAGAVIIDPVTVADCEFLLPIGTVKFLSSAAQTGVIKWYMIYKPLSPSSVVTAAA